MEVQYIVLYVKDGDRQAEFDIVRGPNAVEEVVDSYRDNWDEDMEGEEFDESKFKVFEVGRELRL